MSQASKKKDSPMQTFHVEDSWKERYKGAGFPPREFNVRSPVFTRKGEHEVMKSVISYRAKELLKAINNGTLRMNDVGLVLRDFLKREREMME